MRSRRREQVTVGNKFWNAVVRMHTAIYRRTGGRVFATASGLPLLLLTTRGRKTGRDRTSPIGYLKDGERFVLVASAAGSPRHPAWYLNLREEPGVTVQVKNQVFKASAETASPEQRARLWPLLVEQYSGFKKYQSKVEREIPVVVLSPK